MLNCYSDNIVTTLNITENTYITEKAPTDMTPIDKAIKFQKSLECPTNKKSK